MHADPRAGALAALAVLGSVFTVVKIVDDQRNYRAVQRAISEHRAVRPGPRFWIATASLASSVGQLFVWFGFLAIGGIGLTYPIPAPRPRVWRNQAIFHLLIAMELVLAAIQVWQIAARSQVRSPRLLVHVSVTDDEE